MFHLTTVKIQILDSPKGDYTRRKGLVFSTPSAGPGPCKVYVCTYMYVYVYVFVYVYMYIYTYIAEHFDIFEKMSTFQNVKIEIL